MNRLNLTYRQTTHNASLSGTFVGSAFTGKERDSESGFYYFGARYHDPALLTSFLSVDPISDKYPNLSPYAYCAWTRPTGGHEHLLIKFNLVNNPLKLVDPTGDTCKFANQEDENYVRQLLDKNSKNYSSTFESKYRDLDKSEHCYLFESWCGNKTNGGLFSPKKIDDNTSLIQFIKVDTDNPTNLILGMSEFKYLFEETFHAWKYEINNHYNYPTCYSEAEAWQFSAFAPGTIFFDNSQNMTYMGHCATTSTETLAFEFKIGKPLDGVYPTVPNYQHLELFPNNKFRMNLGYPEWK